MVIGKNTRRMNDTDVILMLKWALRCQWSTYVTAGFSHIPFAATEVAISAPTTLLPARLVTDLPAALARLRMARDLNPRHEIIPGTTHKGCDICCYQQQFDELCDRLPRPR